MKVFMAAPAPRVRCPEHGVVVASVPWARANSWFTRDFEDQTAWLAVHTNRSAVSELMRVAWRTVTRVVEVVGEEHGAHPLCHPLQREDRRDALQPFRDERERDEHDRNRHHKKPDEIRIALARARPDPSTTRRHPLPQPSPQQ